MYESTEFQFDLRSPNIRVQIEIAEEVKNDKEVRDQTDRVIGECLILLNKVILVREALDLPVPEKR